jgi:Caspase domain/Trypsin-like peptidase domain
MAEMDNHAIVIGIDGYAGAWALDGAVRDALGFAVWLVRAGGVAPARLRLLLAPAAGTEVQLPPELAGAPPPLAADSTSVLDTVTGLVDSPPAQADRLFFYFAGHGCSAPAANFDKEPVLIPADYQKRSHANRLLPLSVIIPELAKARVFRQQFFFVDACRDFVPDDVLPGLLAGAKVYDAPHQYVLYATSPGQKAEERGKGVWTHYLLASLQGEHGALVPSPTGGSGDGPSYQVRFRELAEFLESQIRTEFEQRYPYDWQQRVQVPQYKPGSRPENPVLAAFDPAQIRPLQVSLLVDPRSALAQCRLTVKEFHPGTLTFEPRRTLPPPIERPARLDLPINHYRFEATSGAFYGITPAIRLTRDQTVPLTLAEAAAAPPAPAPPARAPLVDQKTGLSEEQLREALERLHLDEVAHKSYNLGSVGEEAPPAEQPPIKSGFSLKPPAASAPARPSLLVRTADPTARIVVRDAAQQPVAGGEERAGGGRAGRAVRFGTIAPGLYEAELHLPEGEVARTTVLIEAGAGPRIVELAAPPVDAPPHVRALLSCLGYDPKTGYAFPAQGLGGMARPRLASLLAFAAFAANPDAVQAAPLDAAALRAALPVTPFGAPRETTNAEAQLPAAGLLVLIGSAVAEPAAGLAVDRFIASCRATVLRPAREGAPLLMERATLRPLGDAAVLGAAAEWQLPLERAGPLMVELRLPHFSAARYAVATLPGRLSVLVAVVEPGGAIEVQQYILPLPAAAVRPEAAIPPDVRALATRLETLRGFELAQRIFNRGDLAAVVDPEVGLGADALAEILYAKWLDPLAGALAGYALVRAGRTGEYAGSDALENMLRHFPELPDVHVLAGLCRPAERTRHFAKALATGGLPVFREGVVALAGLAADISPALAEATAGRLLPGSPWSAWLAVQPMLDVRDGRFATPPAVWRRLEEARPQVERTLRSAGRLELFGPAAVTPFVGTAFVAGPGILMTSWWVARMLLREDGDGVWRLRRDLQGRVDFRQERNQQAAPEEHAVTGFLGCDQQAQIALFAIAPGAGPMPPPPPPIPLAAAPPAGELIGRPVYIVSYPMPREAADPAVHGQKRLQPGEILGVSPDGRELYHDCLTAPGSAGAALVDLATGWVLGVHQSGLRDLFKGATAVWSLREPGRDPGLVRGLAWAPEDGP